MEAIRADGQGASVSFDGRYVTITRRRSIGHGSKTIAVHQITDVRWKDVGVLTAGFIQFTIPGAIEPRTSRESQITDAVRDENTVTFTRRSQPAFEHLMTAIEQAIARRGNSGPMGDVSVAEELTRLGRLVQQRVLTHAEFEVQKARLLS